MSLRRAAEALTEGFAGKRGLIFVDDAHALDDASAALLLHVARANLAFVLVTIRTGEHAPDALRGLWKDELPRIDLAALDRAALDALLPAILGAAVDGATAHALHEASQGNPLYLRELVGGLVDRGGLSDENGLWRLHGPISAPPRLAELISERLDGLTGRERFVLQTIALAEPLGVRIVERLGWGKEWDSLEQRGLVAVHRSDRRQYLRVAHPMYADVVRTEVSTRRRHAILRGSAESVDRHGLAAT